MFNSNTIKIIGVNLKNYFETSNTVKTDEKEKMVVDITYFLVYVCCLLFKYSPLLIKNISYVTGLCQVAQHTPPRKVYLSHWL